MLRLLNKNQNQNSVWQINKSAAMADRFSTLPEHIIHNIMSFLPSIRDAMALSMVSRTFSSAFLCLPIMDMDMDYFFFSDLKSKQAWFSYALLSIVERCCPTIYTELYLAEILGWSKEDAQVLFLDSLMNYLQNRRINVGLDKFRFVARDASQYFDSFKMKTLFSFCIDNNVKEVELDFVKFRTLVYRLPPQLISSKTIRALTIKGLKLGILEDQDLIVSCPSLENLSLINCENVGIVSLVCNVVKLKVVEIENCREINVVHGPLPCLEYFSVKLKQGLSYCICNLDTMTSSTCPRLKHMQFSTCGIPNKWIYNLFDAFRFLQTLKLEGCCKFKEISFQRLEYLHSLEFDSVDFMKVEMEAPNLVSLIYNSESARSPEINICSTNLKHLQFEGANVPKNWVAHNFSEFPFLETLKLIGSHRWMEIKFHLENLNALELDSVDFTQVEIEAPNLVSLIYKSISNRSCSINISSSSSTNLKQLQFEGVNVPQNWVAQNFSEFRFLETLKLTDSHWNLREIKFHLENLNALELDSVNFWKVEIEAPNLVSLIYKSGYGTPLEINISSSSTSLKHLQFEGKSVPKRWVAENFSEFCFLETLKLNTDCPFPSKKFKFQLQCLKVLILNLKFTRSELFTCEIEAPNLVSFMYMNEDDGWNSSTSVRVTPLVTFTSKAKPNVILDVSSSEHENNFSSWMHYIRYMKSDFRKNMVIPLSNFKHLKVESQGSHPNTLSFIVDKQVKSLKFYYKKENIESWQLDLEKK
ncbi:uncharacterized protein LOC112491738 isoform X1 [Ziziphus jujuba]|uniref:Uncharacterized protein LOC112491738 isoform X1 n=1 Tax=Ziziphus jujuba TaxID=326968 RepID=A0ABM3IK37_ZIZJJ|nr:uncharacterized protein LOC112491738 isoform X1 [Ziziphus jujuba]